MGVYLDGPGSVMRLGDRDSDSDSGLKAFGLSFFLHSLHISLFLLVLFFSRCFSYLLLSHLYYIGLIGSW